MKKYLLLLFAVAAILLPAKYATANTFISKIIIDGIVKNELGAPLENVAIAFDGIRMTKTDKEGRVSN